MKLQDRINQTTFSNAGAVAWLENIEEFVDAGERAAYCSIAQEIRSQPILELGVGGGRLVKLLRGAASRFVAVDYLPAMVESTHRKFPDVDVRLGDARDLSAFADNSFYLVAFAFAGIDAVDHEGRRQILEAAHRVLKPGGLFWFSTLNKEGGEPQKRPWKTKWPTRAHRRGSGIDSAVLETLRNAKETMVSCTNYLRLKPLSIEGDGWSVAPFSAHSYGLLVHYTTLTHQIAELARAGFESTPQIFDTAGRSIAPADDLRNVDVFNIVARKIQRTISNNSISKISA